VFDASALQVLLLVLTGWLERREREAIAYLIEENCRPHREVAWCDERPARARMVAPAQPSDPADPWHATGCAFGRKRGGGWPVAHVQRIRGARRCGLNVRQVRRCSPKCAASNSLPQSNWQSWTMPVRSGFFDDLRDLGGCDNIATWLDGSTVTLASICFAMPLSCSGFLSDDRHAECFQSPAHAAGSIDA
jgi:hypothetical protein